LPDQTDDAAAATDGTTDLDESNTNGDSATATALGPTASSANADVKEFAAVDLVI